MTGNKTNFQGRLIDMIRTYILLRKEYVKLNLLEKGSMFLSNMFLILACLLFGCFALLCLSFAIAYLLGEVLQNFVWGFFIVSGVYILLIFILILFKERLIINPMIRDRKSVV